MEEELPTCKGLLSKYLRQARAMVTDESIIVNPRKLEHRFRMIHAGIPFTLRA